MRVQRYGVRIALLTYSTRPRGSVVHTLSLAEALAHLGQPVTVHGLGRSGDTAFFRSLDPRVRTVVTPLPDQPEEDLDAKVGRSIAVLGAAVDTGTYDVVHAQDCIAANAVDTHCLRTVHHLETFTTPALVRCHERAVLEPPVLICVSRQVAEEVRTTHGRTATVVANGVDAERFATVDPHLRQRWRDRLGGDPLVVTVGGSSRAKAAATSSRRSPCSGRRPAWPSAAVRRCSTTGSTAPRSTPWWPSSASTCRSSGHWPRKRCRRSWPARTPSPCRV